MKKKNLQKGISIYLPFEAKRGHIAYKFYLTEPFMDKKLYVNTAFMLEMAVMNLNKI